MIIDSELEPKNLISAGDHFQFNIDQQIGQGTFGKVFKGRRRKNILANQQQNDKPEKVAVKVIKYRVENMITQDLKEFMKQKQAMEELASPGVIQIYDWQIIKYNREKRLAIVMQLMDGSLEDILKEQWKGNPIPEEKSTSLLYQVVQAYRYIYEKSELKKTQFSEGGDIIHRDLKPANIMWKKSEQGAKIFKIGDFGSIRNEKARKKMSQNKGTFFYQAPQMKMEKTLYSNKADVYAIGVIFFQLLNGYKKFPTQLPDKQNEIYCVDPLTKDLNQYQLRKVLEKVKASNNAIEFIINCLKQEQSQRYSWNDVFKHPIFRKNLKAEQIERSSSSLLQKTFNFFFGENKKAKAQKLFEMGWAEQYEKLDYLKAMKLYLQALEIYKSIKEEQNQGCSNVLYFMGIIYVNQGNYESALECYNRAISNYEIIFGKNSQNYANTLQNISSVYKEQGNLQKAMELYSQVLEMYKSIKEEQSQDCSNVLNQIGNIYWKKGQYESALECYNRALSIREIIFGKNSKEYASILGNIGIVYKEKGNLQKARSCYDEALTIKQKIYGKQHIQCVAIINNIAVIESGFNNFDKSIEMKETVLNITSNHYGENHIKCTLYLNNLGDDYRRKGDTVKAMKYLQKALSIFEVNKVQKHDDLGHTFKFMGYALFDQGKIIQAVESWQQAKKIYEQIYGPNNQNKDFIVVCKNIEIFLNTMK